MQNVFDILQERNYIEQMTHPEQMKEMFSKESVPFYIGIDPTADSLHVGHFVSLMVASHMQKCGHKPIILMGGGTAIIGDPSGKTDMRKMLTKEDIEHNVACIKKQVEKFVSFEGENAAIIVNNADWLCDLKYIDFMREMGYMLMQSYDFLHLYETYGCKLEMGGNDQWSNIIGGVELIRKIGKDDSFGLTFKLLTTKEGKKMGKTEKGALWLDSEKTSPYEFYQYWRNIDDSSVYTVGCMLTYLPMEEVNRLASLKDEKINEAKKVLAYEITKLVHGEEEAKKAEEASNALFEGNGSVENMPRVKLSNPNCSLTEAMVECGICSSKSQAKTLISQGAISLNDEKISDISYVLSDKDFETENTILKKGKKIFYCLEK